MGDWLWTPSWTIRIDPKTLVLRTRVLTTLSQFRPSWQILWGIAIFHISVCCKKLLPLQQCLLLQDPTFMLFRERSQAIAIGKYKRGHAVTCLCRHGREAEVWLQHFRNIGTRSMWMFSTALRPFYLQEITSIFRKKIWVGLETV